MLGSLRPPARPGPRTRGSPAAVIRRGPCTAVRVPTGCPADVDWMISPPRIHVVSSNIRKHSSPIVNRSGALATVAVPASREPIADAVHVDSCALVPERERDQSADRVRGAGRQRDAAFLDWPDHVLTFNGRVRNIPDELRAVIPGSFRLPIEIDLLWRSVADGHGQPLSDRAPSTRGCLDRTCKEPCLVVELTRALEPERVFAVAGTRLR